MTRGNGNMTNSEILVQVSRHDLSPEQAADRFIENDRERRAELRPRWMPPVAWALLVLVGTLLLAACLR